MIHTSQRGGGGGFSCPLNPSFLICMITKVVHYKTKNPVELCPILFSCIPLFCSLFYSFSGLADLRVEPESLRSLGTEPDFLLLLTYPQVGVLGKMLCTKALSWITASHLAVILSLEVVAAFILQVLIVWLMSQASPPPSPGDCVWRPCWLARRCRHWPHHGCSSW